MTAPARPPHAALIERNMELAFALLREQAAHPETAADIPDGATVIFIPDDDAELAAFNRSLGLKALEEGEDVYFRHVRGGALLVRS
jgi:uncharacterized protein DUF5647